MVLLIFDFCNRSFFSTKAEINKSDLIQILRQKENLTAEQAKSAVDGLLETITNAVAKGEKVSIVGFGSFEKTVRAPRIGRNPKTGEKIDIPEKATPTFKAGKAFKDVVAESHNK